MAMFVVAYLLVGFGWAWWFIHYFLDDRSWEDGPVGPLGAILITLFWVFMAAVILIGVLMYAFGWLCGPGIKKIYGLKED
jgi:hypothetical protein